MELSDRKLVKSKDLQLLFEDYHSVTSRNQVVSTDAGRRRKDSKRIPRNVICVIQTIYVTIRKDGRDVTKGGTFVLGGLPQGNNGD